MSVDKLVDSTQLDSDLTSVANAIRTKGGTSASLAFPAGFVSAINAIPTGGGGSPLPAGYTQMLYLESSGTQYIDTGLYTKANQTYYITGQRVTYSTQVNWFGNNVSGCASFFQSSGNGLSVYYQYGSHAYNQVSAENTLASHALKMDINGLYEYDYASQEYVVLNTQSGSSVTENSAIHNIIFGRSNGTNSRQLSSLRIFRFKVEEGGTLIRDMYPAMRDSDQVLGMYDVVNDVFYTNAGSGTFSAGAMV